MGYSKIRKIKAVNFRSLGVAEIDMTDSPIVALTGSNESGKSSFIRAFGAAAGNLWRAKQAQYIRTGTDGFAVLLELEDGTKVLRKKTNTVNGYTLVLPDGTRRDATKIDVETPDYIEAVMGMSRDPETRESLQVRTYDDRLLFVGTTDGQNYRILHNVINNLDVREATKNAAADSAKLLANADKKRSEVELYNRQLSEIPLIGTEYLTVVLSALERAVVASEKYDKALAALKRYRDTAGGEADKLKDCKLVDVTVARLFEEAMGHFITLRTIKDAPCGNLKSVDVEMFSRLKRGVNLLSELNSKREQDVSVELVCVSENALPLFERAQQTISAISELDASCERLTAGIATVTEVLKNTNMRVVTCDKCGNDMVMPVDIA